MLEPLVVVIGPNPEKHPYRRQGLVQTAKNVETFSGPRLPPFALFLRGRLEAGQGHELQQYLFDLFVIDRPINKRGSHLRRVIYAPRPHLGLLLLRDRGHVQKVHAGLEDLKRRIGAIFRQFRRG